jgi:LysM repeat protein
MITTLGLINHLQHKIAYQEQSISRTLFARYWRSASIAFFFVLLVTSAALADGHDTYTVQPGDNLTRIANRFSTTVSVLIDLNKSKYPCLATNPVCLQIGWVLQVPATTQPSSSADIKYTVQRGDTLYRIAAKTGSPYQTLVDLNKAQYPCLAAKPTCLQIGWVLTLSASSTPAVHCVYAGRTLCAGYDMGVDDSARRRGWVTDLKGFMKMAYPSGLNWGTVFITVGKPQNPPRPGKDLSAYRTLSIELRGDVGGESVNIGIKDNTDPDDGSERKIRVSNLTTSWQTFTFTLSDFTTADVTRLYVVVEFVFEPGWPAQTVYFRNIHYLP